MAEMTLKDKLARVFDDNTDTRQWHNIFDYVIIGMIVVCTIEITLSTFQVIRERYGFWLNFVDIFTTIFFTIEVSLRIWCADRINPKYNGFKGRMRYCFSFYGIVDILATYPFYINLIIPFPYSMTKILRIARLFRLFKYMKSFRLLKTAISSKRNEMFISFQFLIVITLILSLLLFFLEHESQPEVYSNGIYSVLWAFAQYIGDPGGFADTPPVTFGGQFIACIIGVLGIAIFAVPAGLIGAGFTEAMEEEEAKERKKEHSEKVITAFQRKLDRMSGVYVVNKFLSITEIQARMGMKVDDILEGVEESDNLRLINLASTRTIEEKAEDKLAVEVFYKNTEYGCCINRKSKITIVSPVSLADPISGHFAFHLAKFGGFNYLSRECGELRPYKSYYVFNDRNSVEGLDAYMEDLQTLAPSEDDWVVVLLASSGANEPEYPTQVHICYGGQKGDESFNCEDILLNDIEKGKEVIANLENELKNNFSINTDRQKYYNTSQKGLFVRHLEKRPNTLIIRVAWSISCWSNNSYLIAQNIASVLNRCINNTEYKLPESFKSKGRAYENYID